MPRLKYLNKKDAAKHPSIATPAEIPSFEETGLPESYRKEYESNPYLRSASGGFFGIGKLKEQEQYDLESSKYIANLYNRYYKEQYENPVASAARERLAGLNPDLVGLSDAGSAQVGDIVSPSDIQFADPVHQASGVGEMLLNLASLSLAIPEGLSAIAGQNLSNAAQQIMNAVNMDRLAQSHTSDFPDLAKDSEGINPIASAILSVSRGETLANQLFPGKTRSSSKLRKQFSDAYRLNQNTLRTQIARVQNMSQLISGSIEISDDARSLLVANKAYQLKSMENKLWLETELQKYYQAHPEKFQEIKAAQDEAAQDMAESQSAVAGANAAEAGFTSKKFRAMDGTKFGESEEEQAIYNKYRTMQLQTDLDTINAYEEEFLGTSPFDDRHIIQAIFRPRNAAEYRSRRRAYKAAQKRVYNYETHSGARINTPVGSIDLGN